MHTVTDHLHGRPTVVHLSTPRGATTCGARADGEAEILCVTCPACIEIHDTITGERNN